MELPAVDGCLEVRTQPFFINCLSFHIHLAANTITIFFPLPSLRKRMRTQDW